MKRTLVSKSLVEGGLRLDFYDKDGDCGYLVVNVKYDRQLNLGDKVEIKLNNK